MPKLTAVTILALAVVALGAIVIYDQVRIADLKEALASQQNEAGEGRTLIGRSTTSRATTLPEHENGIGPGAGDDRRATPATGAGTQVEATAETKNPLKGLAGLMENPAMKDILRQDTRGRIIAKWGPFMDELGADKDLEQSIYELLVDREIFALDKIGTIMSESTSDTDRDLVGTELAATWEASESQLKELLGNDAFKDFKLYEASEPERTELSALRQSMGDLAAGLTVQQEEALMSVMFEERRRFNFTDNYLDEGQFLEVAWSDKSFETFHNEFEQLQRKVSGRAAGILSPVQLQAFNENQANFRDSFIQLKKMEIRLLSSP